MLETMLASAVLPAALDFLKGIGGSITTKFFGLSVDDQIKMQTAEVEKLKALAQLDSPVGVPSQWVVDLRAAFRYVGATLCICIGASMIFVGTEASLDNLVSSGLELISIPFSFIFGERLLLGLKGKK